MKTPSHAEILNMSKQLNSLASTLLPETPGTVEKGVGGGLSLKERLAESWCGKSYYERLAEMTETSNDLGDDQDDGETLDDLQSTLENALNMSKKTRRRSTTNKIKKAKGNEFTTEKGSSKTTDRGSRRRKTLKQDKRKSLELTDTKHIKTGYCYPSVVIDEARAQINGPYFPLHRFETATSPCVDHQARR